MRDENRTRIALLLMILGNTISLAGCMIFSLFHSLFICRSCEKSFLFICW